MTRRSDVDILARALARHTGRALDDIERLDHARGVRTPDGSYMVALYGNPTRGLVVKHWTVRVTRGLRRPSHQAVEELLKAADRRLEAYGAAINVCYKRAQWIVALKENEIVLSNGRILRYDDEWHVFK